MSKLLQLVTSLTLSLVPWTYGNVCLFHYIKALEPWGTGNEPTWYEPTCFINKSTHALGKEKQWITSYAAMELWEDLAGRLARGQKE